MPFDDRSTGEKEALINKSNIGKLFFLLKI